MIFRPVAFEMKDVPLFGTVGKIFQEDLIWYYKGSDLERVTDGQWSVTVPEVMLDTFGVKGLGRAWISM